MIKEYETRDIINVSLGGRWPITGYDYELEGSVLVQLHKRWDNDEEEWRTGWLSWCGIGPFVLRFEGEPPCECGDDELPKEVRSEIEWIIEASLR